jgi:hypothetical protein
MFKLADLAFNFVDNKWLVIDASDAKNEKAVFEIHKATNNGFEDTSFVENLVKRMQSEGVEAVLKSVGAVAITADPVKDPDVAKDTVLDVNTEKPKDSLNLKNLPPLPEMNKAETKPEEKKDEVKISPPKASDFRRRFVRAFRLAVTAMDKNLIDNPLKAAFFEQLVDLGIEEHEASVAVEAAFNKGALGHMDVAVTQTEKYLDLSDEAFIETESVVGDLHIKQPVVSARTSRKLDKEANELRARASRGSVPVSTVTEHEVSDRQEMLNKALPKPSSWNKKNLFNR